MPRGGIVTEHCSLHVDTSTNIAIAAKETYYPILHASQTEEDKKRYMACAPASGTITPSKGRVKVDYRLRVTGTAEKVYRSAILKNGTALDYGVDTVTELGPMVGSAIVEVNGTDTISIGIGNWTDTTTPLAIGRMDFVVTELESSKHKPKSS